MSHDVHWRSFLYTSYTTSRPGHIITLPMAGTRDCPALIVILLGISILNNESATTPSFLCGMVIGILTVYINTTFLKLHERLRISFSHAIIIPIHIPHQKAGSCDTFTTYI